MHNRAHIGGRKPPPYYNDDVFMSRRKKAAEGIPPLPSLRYAFTDAALIGRMGARVEMACL